MKNRVFAVITAVALLFATPWVYASTSVAPDFEQTRQLAEQGDARAQLTLGAMYVLGDGVRQDYTQARHWYEKAASQGYASAQYNLGYMYLNGHGVRQDFTLARQWYEKAANQGHAVAQYNLGLYYESGLLDVHQNVHTAKEWYGKACDNGEQRGCDKYAKLNQAGY